jgi:hypothetical protein
LSFGSSLFFALIRHCLRIFSLGQNKVRNTQPPLMPLERLVALDDLIEGILDAIWPTRTNPTLARWAWRIFWIGVLVALGYSAYLIYKILDSSRVVCAPRSGQSRRASRNQAAN